MGCHRCWPACCHPYLCNPAHRGEAAESANKQYVRETLMRWRKGGTHAASDRREDTGNASVRCLLRVVVSGAKLSQRRSRPT